MIYCDPPWRYSDKRAGRGGAEAHYDTMTIGELGQLPVRDLSDDCALFMWATWPMLPDAMWLMRMWGFEYKTLAFVWVKTTKIGEGMPFEHARPPVFWGCGQWTRSNSEPCLLAVRGDVRPPKYRSAHQVICAQVGRHSEKPEEARRRIEAMFPDAARLELFARRAAPGWDRWGDEAPAAGGGDKIELTKGKLCRQEQTSFSLSAS